MKEPPLFKSLYVLMIHGYILTPDSFKKFWPNYGAADLYGWRPPKKIYYTLSGAKAGLRWVPDQLRDEVEIHEFISAKVTLNADDLDKIERDKESKAKVRAEKAAERSRLERIEFHKRQLERLQA